MEVGTIEGPELFAENQRFHRLLRESGRDVRYREVVGGHDLATWRGGIGDALAHLLGN
jgi:enterochelin esterase-like enzyme